MRGYSPPDRTRTARDLKKYGSLGLISEAQLTRIIEWDRPHQEVRKAPLNELLGKPIPGPWSQLGSTQSSEAVFAIGKFLIGYEGNLDNVPRFRGAVALLQELCDTHPEATRSAIWPAVRALEEARARGDHEAVQALEGVLLRISRKAPAVVVSGILNAGNPRFRSSRKKGRNRWRKWKMVGAIKRASTTFREAFIVPVSHRLEQEGYPSLVAVLSRIDGALDSVLRAAGEPSGASAP